MVSGPHRENGIVTMTALPPGSIVKTALTHGQNCRDDSIDDVGIVAILHTASTIVGRNLFWVWFFSFHST
jgi:hypothetical protein